MNVKVFFVENEDLFLEDELENIDLVKDLIQINGFSSKSSESSSSGLIVRFTYVFPKLISGNLF